MNPMQYYTVEQVAELTGMSERWLWLQCREEKIPHHRFGRAYRFSPADLEALGAQTQVTPATVREVLAEELVPNRRGGRRA